MTLKSANMTRKDAEKSTARSTSSVESKMKYNYLKRAVNVQGEVKTTVSKKNKDVKQLHPNTYTRKWTYVDLLTKE